MKKILSLSLVIVGFTLGATALTALADWTAPSSGCTPPTCNTDAPINVGEASQSKIGPLIINTDTTNPIADIGLTVFGKFKLFNSDRGAGKVLTSDADGVGTWQVNDSTAFCNSISVPLNTTQSLSLIKNGRNMCTDAGGCVIKLVEDNTSHGYRSWGNIIFNQKNTSGAWSAVGGATGGTNGDSSYSAIWNSSWNASIADDSTVETSVNSVSVISGTYGAATVEVCDF